MLLVKELVETSIKTQIKVANPLGAIIKLSYLLHPPKSPETNVHPTAIIGINCSLGPLISLGAYVVIGDNVTIEKNVVIHPHVTIYSGVTISANSVIHAAAVIRENVIIGEECVIQSGVVIGGDGFGYFPQNGRHQRIPHIGNVILKDRVDVGANSTIDRAMLGSTFIDSETKLDNLVMVGHNVKIGQRSLLCGQAGIAGSTEIGNDVVLGGNSGVADHVQIVDGVRLGAKTGAVGSISEKGDYAGYPHMKIRDFKRLFALFRKLPEMLKRIKDLEKKISGISSSCLLILLLNGCTNILGNSEVSNSPQVENPLSKSYAIKILNTEELALLKEAEEDYASELFSSARKNFEKFKENYPASNSINLAILKIADCRFFASEYPEAVTAYEDYLNTFPSSEASPYAFFQVGESWRLQSKGIDRDQTPVKKALTTFEEVAKRYHGTPSAKKASFAIVAIKEQFAEYNKNVAEFYLKIGKEKAAKARELESTLVLAKNNSSDLTVKETDEVVHPQEVSNVIETDETAEIQVNQNEESTETDILRSDKKASLKTEELNNAEVEPGLFAGLFGLFSSSEWPESITPVVTPGDELKFDCRNLGRNKSFTVTTSGEKLNFKIEQRKLKFSGVGQLSQGTCKGSLQINSVKDDAILALPIGETTIFQPDNGRLVAVIKSK